MRFSVNLNPAAGGTYRLAYSSDFLKKYFPSSFFELRRDKTTGLVPKSVTVVHNVHSSGMFAFRIDMHVVHERY
jgi:hypothetical protein